MTQQLTSRERMLEAISCREPDYAPCCFMIFSALRSQCKDEFEFVDRQLELGLDVAIGIQSGMLSGRGHTDQADLGGLPARYDPRVSIREWREDQPGARYPLLHREYATPAGPLHTVVSRTEDYVQGDRVPLFDDYVIPRAQKRLIARHEDLEALQYLLTAPDKRDIAMLQEHAAAVKGFAASRGCWSRLAGGPWPIRLAGWRGWPNSCTWALMSPSSCRIFLGSSRNGTSRAWR